MGKAINSFYCEPEYGYIVFRIHYGGSAEESVECAYNYQAETDYAKYYGNPNATP